MPSLAFPPGEGVVARPVPRRLRRVRKVMEVLPKSKANSLPPAGVSRLENAGRAGRRGALVARMCGPGICQYTIAHFRHEEEILRQCHYPYLAEHRVLHEKMRYNTLAWREHLGLVTGRDLLHLLKQWWVGHIQESDKQYVPYLTPAAAIG